MTALSRVARLLLWAAAVAAVAGGVLASAARLLPVERGPFTLEVLATNLAHAAGPGESLLSRLDNPPVNYHLPMGSILSALLLHRMPTWTWGPTGAAMVCLLAAMTAITGWLAGSLAAGLAAVGLLLWLPGRGSVGSTPLSWWGSSSDYFILAYAILLMGVAAAAVWRERRPGPARSAALGLAIGASLLFRSTLVLLPALWALGDLARLRRRPQGSEWGSLAAVGLLPYAMLLPWVLMNWQVFGRFIPLEDGEANRIIVPGALGFVERVETQWRALLPESVQVSDHGVLWWAVAEVVRHPVRFLRAWVLRLAYAAQWHSWLFLLAAAGAWLGRRSPPSRALALLAFYYVGIHCCLSVWYPYFPPVWPVLALLVSLVLQQRICPQEGRAEDAPARWLFLTWKGCLAGLCLMTWFVVGAYAWALRQRPTSVMLLEQAVARSPENPWILRQRGLQRLRAGNWGGAAEDFEQAVTAFPHERRWRALRALSLMLAGDRRAFYSWAEKEGPLPRDLDNLIAAAYGWFLAGKLEETRRHLRLALRDAPRVETGPQPERGARWECLQAQVLAGLTRTLLGARSAEERSRFLGEICALVPHCHGCFRDRAELALPLLDKLARQARVGSGGTARLYVEGASRQWP